MNTTTVTDETSLIETLVPLQGARIIEAGCGAAAMAREILHRYPSAEVIGIDVDERQLAKNVLEPVERLRFERAGAQAIPFADASFDGAMMLKSLHHVPVALMDQAISEIARVLRPGGWYYVSEPVYDGPLNELVRLYNDEGEVRAAAQAALDRALASGDWIDVADHRFEVPVSFANFEDFERRMMRPTYADHRLDDAIVALVKQRYESHQRDGGAQFNRPMHVRLLHKADRAHS